MTSGTLWLILFSCLVPTMPGLGVTQAITVVSVFVFRRMVCLHPSSHAGLLSMIEKSWNSNYSAMD